jgi:truncated hemoglobin YjbI
MNKGETDLIWNIYTENFYSDGRPDGIFERLQEILDAHPEIADKLSPILEDFYSEIKKLNQLGAEYEDDLDPDFESRMGFILNALTTAPDI